MVDKIAQAVRAHDRFLITSHARPDGDSIGSQLALALALRQLGKTVEIVNSDPVPRSYTSLPGADSVQVVQSAHGFDGLLVVLECSDLSRTGIRELGGRFTVNIDHHPKNDAFGDLNWVDPEAAAVGELVFALLKALDVEITPAIATNLYVAILTDTGSFQFSNTRARTFVMAGELVVLGADPGEIAQAVLMSQPESRLRLLARVLNTLELNASREIAWARMTREMMAETGSRPGDTEGFVNLLLGIEGVAACAFFRDEGSSYRVSLRSKGTVDVAALAELFGGGGHRSAAGLSLSGPFEEVRKKVISALEDLVPRPTDAP